MSEQLNSDKLVVYRPELISAVRETAHPMYMPATELEYHNQNHYPDTLIEADRLIKACEQDGLVVDREVIELALILHDIYSPVPVKEHPGFSQEEFSALLGRELLGNLSVEKNKIDRVTACILFTQAGIHFDDIATHIELTPDLRTCLIITRRADINNLRRSQPEFLSNSVRLYLESRKIHKWYGTKPLPWPQFFVKQQEFLDMLLEDDLSLGSWDQDAEGECLFTKLARPNVRLLSSNTVTNFNTFVQTYGKRIARFIPGVSWDDKSDFPVAS